MVGSNLVVLCVDDVEEEEESLVSEVAAAMFSLDVSDP